MPVRLLALVPLAILSACASRAPHAKAPPSPNPFAPNGQGWIDLHSGMGLRVENAYFREGSPKHTVNEFIGTEIAEYGVDPSGRMTIAALQSKVPRRPADQVPVQALIPAAMARYRFHRFYYQVVFNRSTGTVSGAALLGARSAAELASLGSRILSDPDSVCGGSLTHCAVFPELCSVSVQMTIRVNGETRRVLWGSTLSSVAVSPRTVEVLRLRDGRLTPVEIDLQNPSALRLPLLPGDQVNWQPRALPTK